MAPSASLFGPVDTYLAPYIGFILLGLLLVNIVARAVEYGQLQEQADDGDWKNLSRNSLRVVTSFLLVAGSFYYLTVHYHAGFVFSILVVSLFITDLFEFESRLVEARQDWNLERPKAAIAASFVALLYILYQTLFFVIKPYWDAVI